MYLASLILSFYSRIAQTQIIHSLSFYSRIAGFIIDTNMVIYTVDLSFYSRIAYVPLKSGSREACPVNLSFYSRIAE
jgi:hypothetical protein